MDKKLKKYEAIQRMKELNLMPECIKDFEENDKVWISENQGILFDINDSEIISCIKRFEEHYDTLVYHCILNYLESHKIITMFYVCDEKEEWEMDWQDLKEGYACCYAANLDEPAFSEIGSIQFKKINGGLKRIA